MRPPQLPADRAIPRQPRQIRPTRIGTFVRGLTGSLAVGLLVLGLALIGVQFWATHQGQQGPGLASVIAHVVAAIVALTLQAFADRRRDLVGGVLTVAVFVLTIGSLWFWWWL